MNILNERPPIWDRAQKVFKFKDEDPILFSWGDILYNPAGVQVDDHFRTHEETHGRQQKAMGGPEIWWERYLTDVAFRLDQEAEAYAKQWMSFRIRYRNNSGRQTRYLLKLAEVMASPLYGGNITESDALAMIKKYL